MPATPGNPCSTAAPARPLSLSACTSSDDYKRIPAEASEFAHCWGRSSSFRFCREEPPQLPALTAGLSFISQGRILNTSQHVVMHAALPVVDDDVIADFQRLLVNVLLDALLTPAE